MRVGILGTRWGRIHVGAFRSAGATVHAIVGRSPEASAEVARAEGVACCTLAELEGCDVVVIASPTPTHRQYVERFSRKPLLCEKPLLGAPADDGFVRLVESIPVLYVSYALPFVPAARAFVGAIGGATAYHARVRVALPDIRDEDVAAREIAVHPVALMVHALGDRARGHLTIELGGEPGIAYELRVAGEDGEASFLARYAVGEAWHFEARRGAHAIAHSPASGASDAWYDAHCGLARAFVDRVRGAIDSSEARARGLLDARAALAIERTVRERSAPPPLSTAVDGLTKDYP
jgi:predicted dehydrogenase